MTDEQLKEKKKYAGDKHPSMKRRADSHDYTERRMYMITIEVDGREPLFGRVVGNPFAEGSIDEPRMELTPLGMAVEKEWLGIHRYFPQIEVKAVQMMPDHMHGILFVKAPLPVHLGQVISGFKTGCRKAQQKLAAAQPPPTENAAAATQAQQKLAAAEPPLMEKAAPQPQAQRMLAAAEPPLMENAAENVPVSPSQQVAVPPPQKSPFRSLFAKGYNDLILRSYDELPVWLNYLHDNPRRLLMKRARPEYLRPFFGLSIGSHTYNGIGNRSLLAADHRLMVRISRRLQGEQLEMEISRYLDAARQGAVLVSPAISPGEKRVMRTAFDEGLPTVVLMENGFTELSKPKGEQFYACAAGRLLMLSPWEHHNEKRKITAEQCRQLNLMALEICE